MQEGELIDLQFNKTLESKDSFQEYFVPPNENLEKTSLEFIIQSLLKKDIKVIVVTMPLNPLLLEKIDLESKKNFEEYLNKISNEKNIDLIDYTTKYDLDYFYDGHHLNKKGKEIFSKELGLKILRLI